MEIIGHIFMSLRSPIVLSSLWSCACSTPQTTLSTPTGCMTWWLSSSTVDLGQTGPFREMFVCEIISELVLLHSGVNWLHSSKTSPAKKEELVK